MLLKEHETLESGECTPLDLWIAIAMISSDDHRETLRRIVATSINNLDYQILHMPERWTRKLHAAEIDRAHWVIICDKLEEMCQVPGKIPF